MRARIVNNIWRYVCSANLQNKAWSGDTLNQRAAWRRARDRQSNVIVVCTITKRRIVAMKRESEFAVTNARGTFEMGQRPAVKRSARSRFTVLRVIVLTTLLAYGNPQIVPSTRLMASWSYTDRHCVCSLFFRIFLLYRDTMLQFAISLSQLDTMFHCFQIIFRLRRRRVCTFVNARDSNDTT